LHFPEIVRCFGVISLFLVVVLCLQTSCSGVAEQAVPDQIPIIKIDSINRPQSNDSDDHSGDSNGTIVVKTALYGFGGMYSYSGDGFRNPATNAFACPSGYNSIQIHGSEGEDADLYVCQKSLAAGERGYFDFGGMYGYHSAGVYENPITGDTSCPEGFTAHQAYGDETWDFDLFYCTRIAQPDVRWEFGFGGMFGEQRDDPNGYQHSMTNNLSCPNSQTEFAVLGSSNKDWPLHFCAETLTEEAEFESVASSPDVNFNLTEYDRGYFGFGGMYSVSRTNPANSVRNPATGELSCPDGYIAHQIQGRDFVNGNSNYDADLYFCYLENQGRFELAKYDFGGLYGYGSSYYQWKNPFTNAMSCPAGFSSYKVLDEYGLDWPMWFCYREQKREQPTPYSFGGMYSSGDPGVLGFYPNVGALNYACPTGHYAAQSHGAEYSRLDIRIFMCGSVIP